MDKETLLRTLHQNEMERNEYLDTVPPDLQSAIFDNTYVNKVWEDNTILLKEVFGDQYLAVEWFLHEWKPGYNVGVNGVTKTINNIDDYIDWLKEYEGWCG